MGTQEGIVFVTTCHISSFKQSWIEQPDDCSGAHRIKSRITKIMLTLIANRENEPAVRDLPSGNLFEQSRQSARFGAPAQP